jgi:hypothetical protein
MSYYDSKIQAGKEVRPAGKGLCYMGYTLAYSQRGSEGCRVLHASPVAYRVLLLLYTAQPHTLPLIYNNNTTRQHHTRADTEQPQQQDDSQKQRVVITMPALHC